MRSNIVHPGADELKYEIRAIVKVAKKLEKCGIDMIWENIGDPVQKGNPLPDWMKEIIMRETQNDSSYGYCPTKGLEATRQFLADLNNQKKGAQITAEDILFFNGLGDAISTFYHYLHPNCRVLGPSPAYSTHSSAEAAHAGAHHITYNLDPNNNWMPDLEDLYNKVKYNPLVGGILILNPDNPTGAVYPLEVLEQIVEIAKEFELFLVADEIYQSITYNGFEHISLANVIGEVPGVSMKGISKEFPWPGSRCAWVEFYNSETDPIFARFAKSLEDAKMLEVCSTTLPQKVIPDIMSDSRYAAYQQGRNALFEKRSIQIDECLQGIDGITFNRTNGAFYFTVVFQPEKMIDTQCLPVAQDALSIIEPELQGAKPDMRFTLYLMASKGVCVVPLSEFNSDLLGFRMTLLEMDESCFLETCQKIRDGIQEYLQSASQMEVPSMTIPLSRTTSNLEAENQEELSL